MYCCRRQKGEQRVRTAAGNRMKREWIGFLFLLLLSVRDIREKKVNIDNIVYIENSLHRACFHLVENDSEKEYTVYKKLDDIEQEIKEEKFVRLHQSFIVNMDYVCDVKRYYAKLVNGRELPVSKQSYKSVACEYIKQRGQL